MVFLLFSIYNYGLVSRGSAILIIGGWCDDSDSSLIAKYTLDKWTKFGNLQKNKTGLRAISNGDRIYVVGGSNYQRWETVIFLQCFFSKFCFFITKNVQRFVLSTEIWSLDEDGNTVNVKVAEPVLISYVWYPELFLVPSDFCSKNWETFCRNKCDDSTTESLPYVLH